MDLAPGKEVLMNFSPALSGETLSSTVSEARRRTYILLSIAGLAFLLRLYGISSYPLQGDEYESIWAAKSVGLNWNSIIYSSLMHFWVRLGTSELWLRMPAAIFGTATVPILFKLGEKLGGWRTGVVAGLLAALSPFNIYHSQEVRFYSFFIFCSAAFMLATISYVESRKTTRDRLLVLLTGLVLIASHFLGVLALYAQCTAAFVATSKNRRWRAVLATVGLPVLIFGLPLIPLVHSKLLHIYQVLGNGWGADLSSTPLSLINLAKLAFAGFTFVFGYHVYPQRLALVIGGLALSGFLLVCGIRKLWQQKPEWRALPFTYLLALVGVYMVLEAIGGRLASGVSPRHVAFVWPAFVLLLALGLSSFARPAFHFLLVAVIGMNALSIWYGWQKDWTYGIAIDYRTASAYAVPWLEKDGAIISDNRAWEAINVYFPKGAPLLHLWVNSTDQDLDQTLRYRNLMFVTADWRFETRRALDQLMGRLSGRFTFIDGRVDYPLFEYVFERRTSPENSGYSLNAGTGQLRQPLSFYGVEFQDLRLPITVKVKDVPLQVVGAYGLPNSEGSSQVTIPLSQPTHAGRLILLTDVVDLNETQTGQPVAEVVVESKSGAVSTFPLRLNRETVSWDNQCQPTAECKTVFQWHKRLALAGRNGFPDAWRDFPAGLHGVLFDLPQGTDVTTLTFRYLAGSGHFYIWAIALAA